MVASSNSDLYTPFPHMPVIEEGVQSSEEGSDLHSPVFEPAYATPDGTYTLSRCGGALRVHMSDWRKKAGITLVTSTTMSLASCYRRHRHLTLATTRAWFRTPEIPISWRHYNLRALQPCNTIHTPLSLLPTCLFMDTRCSN